MRQNDQPIDVKTAVKKASAYLRELYADEDVQNLLLEEVDFDEDEQVWLVTLGFDTHQLTAEISPAMASVAVNLNALNKPRYVRAYKVVKIRAADGEVLSMKIREL